MVQRVQKLRILFHHRQGKRKAPTIAKLLRSEGLSSSRQGVAEVLKRYERRRTIKRKSGSGGTSKVTAEIKQFVEEQMRLDDQTTATQLHALLNRRGYSLPLRTILRCRTSLGWTFRGSSYHPLLLGVVFSYHKVSAYGFHLGQMELLLVPHLALTPVTGTGGGGGEDVFVLHNTAGIFSMPLTI